MSVTRKTVNPNAKKSAPMSSQDIERRKVAGTRKKTRGGAGLIEVETTPRKPLMDSIKEKLQKILDFSNNK